MTNTEPVEFNWEDILQGLTFLAGFALITLIVVFVVMKLEAMHERRDKG